MGMAADLNEMHAGDMDRHHLDRPFLMGILNVTPDSFSDGGEYSDVADACNRAVAMVTDGADIIDIGGESSRPGAASVRLDEELHRILPVVEAIAEKVTIPLSIDTTKSDVARAACSAGASIINDITALRHDPEMAFIAAESDAKVVLMHMQGTPQTMQINPVYGDVVEDVLGFLVQRIEFAVNNGIQRERIIIDPGIGFGKTLDHNLKLLHNIHRFHELGCPVLLGVSRKGFIGQITGEPVDNRVYGTAAIVAHAILNGVQIHRVHDVKEMRQICDMLEAIGMRAWE